MPTPDPVERSLTQNVRWAVAGTLCYAACQWGILIVVARLAGAAELGEFTFGVALTAPIVMLANMQLRSVQTSDARREFGFEQYLGLRAGTSLAALALIAGLALGLPISGYTAAVVIAVGLAKVVESISDVLYGAQLHQERMQDVALSLAIRGVAGAAIVVPAVLWTGSALAGALALTAAWMAVLLVFDIPRAGRTVRQQGGRLRPDWRPSTQRRLLRLAWPLGIASFLNSLNVNVPRYVIRHQLGAADLGVYSAFAYLISAGSTVVTALGQSALARLSRAYAAGRVAAYLKLAAGLCGVIAGLAAAAWLTALFVGERAVALVYGPRFESYAFLLAPIIGYAAVHFLASLLGYCAAAVRQFRGQAPVCLLATVATLVTCSFTIPSLGLVGAVWAGLAGAAVQLLGNLCLVAFALLRDGHPGAARTLRALPAIVHTER